MKAQLLQEIVWFPLGKPRRSDIVLEKTRVTTFKGISLPGELIELYRIKSRLFTESHFETDFDTDFETDHVSFLDIFSVREPSLETLLTHSDSLARQFGKLFIKHDDLYTNFLKRRGDFRKIDEYLDFLTDICGPSFIETD